MMLEKQQRLGAGPGEDLPPEILLQRGDRTERNAPEPGPARVRAGCDGRPRNRLPQSYPSDSSAKKSASTKSTLTIVLITPTP